MTRLLRFARVLDAVSERCARLAAWLVLVACLISAAVAFVRYGLSAGSNAFVEIQWYLFAAMVMLGAPFVLRENEHVRVDIFYGRLPPERRVMVDIFGLVAFLLPATIVMTWLSWKFFHASWAVDETSPNPGGLLRWPAKFLLPLGFGLLTLQGLAELIKRVAHLTGLVSLGTDYEKPMQ